MKGRWSWTVVVATLVVLLWPYGRLVSDDGDLTRLIRFGESFRARSVPALQTLPHVTWPDEGFDGQFYAQLAFDPLVTQPATAAAMDNVTVRARRIFSPATAYVLGAGQPRWILWTYPLLSLAAWLALAWLAWIALKNVGAAGMWAWVAIVLGPGAIESASRCLPDLPAFVLSWASLQAPLAAGTGLVALAALGRETALLAWLARIVPVRSWPAARVAILSGLVATVPLLIWAAWLHWRFPGVGRADGDNLDWPLRGVMARVGEISVQFATQSFDDPFTAIVGRFTSSVALMLSFFVQLAYLALHRQAGEAWWRFGALCGAFVLCLGWNTWEAHFTVARHLLPLHVAFNLLLARATHGGKPMWFLLGNLYVVPRIFYWAFFP